MSMNNHNSISLFKSLKDEMEQLAFDDNNKLDSIKRRTNMIVTKVFGDKSEYLNDFKYIHLFRGILHLGSLGPPPPRNIESDKREWMRGRQKWINQLDVIIEELEITEHSSTSTGKSKSITNIKYSNRVFIVHGHDEGCKQSVARCVERLDLTAIILHEKSSSGKTLIEKLESHGEVGYSVIILTPDDLGTKKSDPKNLKPRARQNVILELGYFIGRLGRSRVCVLQKGEIEPPTDILGVVWINFDVDGGWKSKLADELKTAGYDIDKNKL
ncbi:MAG: nucleotide-binding protein [Candidatus Hatepunaea meridiana]|nr:nucleotide-binding protein [Candidatus Hatepunaea meridiana]